MRHAAIIGAGPAGSMAAILLARRGVRVTLIEQSRFPRDKVCGECVSALGIAVLTRHQLIGRLRLRGAIDLRRALFHASTGESCELALPQPMLGISRSTLDNFLLEEARAAGAIVLQPARCESIVNENDPTTPLRRDGSRPERPIVSHTATEIAGAPGTAGDFRRGADLSVRAIEVGIPPRTASTGVAVTVRSLVDQSLSTLHADVALLADGKANLLPHRPPLTGDFGIKTHFTGVEAPTNAIELFGVVGHYGGLSEVEGDRWNCSFAVPAARLRAAHGDLDKLFAQIVAESPALIRRLKNARRCSDWHSAPLPRFGVKGPWPKNVIPIGNAAAAIEPIGGEGIGLALRSAELATDALLAGSFEAPLLQQRYRELWTARRFACRAAAKIISSPSLAGMALSVLGDQNPLTARLMDWMGK